MPRPRPSPALLAIEGPSHRHDWPRLSHIHRGSRGGGRVPGPHPGRSGPRTSFQPKLSCTPPRRRRGPASDLVWVRSHCPDITKASQHVPTASSTRSHCLLEALPRSPEESSSAFEPMMTKRLSASNGTESPSKSPVSELRQHNLPRAATKGSSRVEGSMKYPILLGSR